MKTLIGQIGLLRGSEYSDPFAKSKLHLSRPSYVYLLTTLVTIKNTIKILVEHYGLFLNYFHCFMCFFDVESLFLQLLELGTSRS